MDRAMKHFIIAAKSGFGDSLKEVGDGCKAGHVTKAEYAAIKCLWMKRRVKREPKHYLYSVQSLDLLNTKRVHVFNINYLVISL